MLEASRGPYKIAWIIQCKDDIEKCTSRSFDPIGVILWRVYQSLHRLHQNGMKLSEMIELGVLMKFHYMKGFGNLLVVSEEGAKLEKIRK